MTSKHHWLYTALAAGSLIVSAPALADNPPAKNTATATTAADARQILKTWGPGQQLAGEEMMAKYGPPQEVTSDRMIWRDAGPFKRILLTKEMFPHDFPLPHMDYLEHTINYNVPPDRTDEVHAFDASMSIYRVGGELSARCDLESNNVLTLNLANEVATGKKTVAQARKEFGEAVVARTLGKNPPITAALQFKPQVATKAADPEAITIPGVPQRADANKPGDADILGQLIAVDLDEVHAASVAETKKLPAPVMAFAKMLHEMHGQNVKASTELNTSLKLAAIQTPATRAMHDKHAGDLATIVALDGDAFSTAFLDMMVKGHTEALQLIDKSLAAAKADGLKAHLTKSRAAVEAHLAQAKQLQSGTKTSSR